MAYNYEYPYTDPNRYNSDWILNRVKELSLEWIETRKEWNNTREEFESLKEFIQNYFAQLDLQDEVNVKLDIMARDGSLSALISPLFSEYIDYVTPQMYGAKGDGVTDDTEALKEMLKTKSNIVFPPGNYLVTDTIELSQGAKLEGSFTATLVFKENGNLLLNSDCSLIGLNISANGDINAATINLIGNYCHLDNLRISGGNFQFSISSDGHSISNIHSLDALKGAFTFTDVNDAYISNVFVINCGGISISMFGRCEAINVTNFTALNGNTCFNIASNSRFCKFTNCFFDSAKITSLMSNVTDIIFTNTWFSNRTNGISIHCENCSNISFIGCDFVNNNQYALVLTDSVLVTIADCLFDSNEGYSIYITGTNAKCIIEGNKFSKIYDNSKNSEDIKFSDGVIVSSIIITNNILKNTIINPPSGDKIIIANNIENA